MGCFSGRLMSAASDQKLFCELCSVFNCSFDEFVGEKVVSPSYSSAILAPPPISFFSMAEWYSIVCIYYIFFSHLSVSGHLGCFHILAIVNRAAKNIEVHVSF